MKGSTRDIIKEQKGIHDSDTAAKKCRKCLFYQQKICQIHGIKTNVGEVCNRFKPITKTKIVHGGGVSPR